MDPTLPAEEQVRYSPLKAPRKRKRIVISCTECHRRKQKCDRAAPCSNCVARNKQSLCHYENESARKQQLLEENGQRMLEGGSYGVIKPGESDSAAQVSAFGYAKSNGNSNTTLGIFKKIENYGTDGSVLPAQPTPNAADHGGLREKYKNLIRQLPSKEYIEKLLTTYFSEVNYQYSPLDEGIFRDHLRDWHNLSFSTLSKGPLELPPDLRFFPALLFQTLALALQFQPQDYDPTLDSLKYAAAMSFDDLASDYSESGCQILCLLGKRHTTLITVQAGFLRCAYLKNCGLIPESWHYLSQTIRDAQEIGLHKDLPYHQNRRQQDKPEDVLENLWLDQLRRRMWLILSLWDIHMALTLGRPTTVDCRDGKPAFPMDAPTPRNRREVAPSPRTESDPPTPLTMLLWLAEISAPLWDIFHLQREDPHQNNIQKVEQMHKLISQISLHCPPFFRAENPDTSFDSHPDCYWLPMARHNFQNGTAFTIMCLHRPYIFTNPSSRTAALKAGLDILRAQRAYFSLLQVKHYKMFTLVLNSFDAIVLAAAIYILHPCENVEDLEPTLKHFEWAMERFHTMSERNSMASAALGVLKAIHVRLKRVLDSAQCPAKPLPSVSTSSLSTANLTPPSMTPESSSTTSYQGLSTPINHTSISGSSNHSAINQNQPGSPTYNIPPLSNMPTNSNMKTDPSLQSLSQPQPQPQLPMTSSAPPPPTTYTPQPWDPSSSYPTFAILPNQNPNQNQNQNLNSNINPLANFDISSMAPLQPMHDLLYNDLATINNELDLNGLNERVGWVGDNIGNGGGNGGRQWQFEGDFGNDSFWGFMNSYNP